MLKIVALLSLLCSLSNAAQLSLFPKLRHVQHRTASKSILPQARESIKSRFEALIASNDTEYEYAQVCTSSEVSSVNSCIENVFLFELDCNSTAEYAAKLLRCIEVYCNAECEDDEVFFEFFYTLVTSVFEEYTGVCDSPGACDAVNSVVDDPTAAPTFEDIGGNGTEYEGNYSEYEYGGNTDVCLNGNLSGFNKCMSEIYPYEYEYGGEYEYGREYEYGIDNCVFINTFFLDNLHCLEVSCATSCTDIEPIIVNALEFYNELLNCTFDLSCDQFTTAPTASPTVSPTAHLTPITLPVTDTLRFLFILVAFCLVVVILLIIVIVLLCQSRRRQTQLTVLEGSNEEKKAFKQKEMEAKELL